MSSYSLNTELFWSKVDKQDSCWLWTGRRQSSGYGIFHVKVLNKWTSKTAHRISYELSVGKVPEGKELDHICFTRLCVRPSHLRPVTRKQNMEHRQGPHATSKSGVRGVWFHTSIGKWVARVGHHGKIIHVGHFKNLEDAAAAVKAKRNELFTHNNEAR